ncbi:hypothetical protein CIB48_g4379 [Xylaria polymorpha]|nr:hypothetical protein CIB48_g4379 [Xylaria polymorpha]
MAARSPRTVADATRFTSNRPHANTKSGSSSSPNASSAATATQQTPLPRRTIPQETMDERVRRLRAAHLAAKQHDVSRMDQVIGSSRRLFDAAHKFTVMGLIGFSGIALLVTVYATADMMMYNRKRRNEFFALQKQLKEDSLEAARLAYMTGTATEEQIALVEDATARAKEANITLPSILSPPQTAGAREATPSTSTSTAAENEEKTGGGGVTGWFFGGLKKEDVSDDRWRSTSTATTSTTPHDNAPGDALRDKAKAAFDAERDNERRGGPLD